jgi:hypothetical protein
MNKVEGNSNSKPAPSTTRSAPVKRRRRRHRVYTEVRQTARQIADNGMAEAMKAATLMIVSRKLDEIRTMLAASGMSGGITLPPTSPPLQPSPPLAPVIKHPCVQCGREGVYKSKPSQWNRTGSWHCRIHMVLATTTELEDRMDRSVNTQPPRNLQQDFPAQPAPGASTLAEAMGMATVEEEPNG